MKSRIALVFIFLICLTSSIFSQNKKYWVASSTANWNSSNWSLTSGGAAGAAIPNATDTVYFDVNGLGSCNLTSNESIAALRATIDFTGTIDLGNNIFTLGSGGLSVLGGTLNANNSDFEVNGNLEIGNGVNFTSTTGTLKMTGIGTPSFVLGNTTTFNHNNGTIKFSNGDYALNYGFNAAPFFNLITNTNVVFNETLQVENKLVLDQGVLSSSFFNSIKVKDSLIINTGFDSIKETILEFYGAGNSHYIVNSPLITEVGLIINKDNATDTVHCYKGTSEAINLGTGRSDENFHLSKGVLDFPEGDLVNLTYNEVIIDIDGKLLATSDTLVMSIGKFNNGSGFKHNNGTVKYRNHPYAGLYPTHSETTYFYDLIFQCEEKSTFDSIIVENKLVLDSGVIDSYGGLFIRDSLIVNSGFDSIRKEPIHFVGPGNSHYIVNSPLIMLGLIINKDNATDTVHCYKGTSEAINLGTGRSGENFYLSKGVLDFPEGDLVNLTYNEVDIDIDGKLLATSDTLVMSIENFNNGSGFKHNNGTVKYRNHPNAGLYPNHFETTYFYDLIFQCEGKPTNDSIIVENKLVLDSGVFLAFGHVSIWDSLIINTGFDSIRTSSNFSFNGSGDGHFIVNKPLKMYEGYLNIDKENTTDTVHCYKGSASSIDIGRHVSITTLNINKGVLDFPENDLVNLTFEDLNIKEDGTLLATKDSLILRVANLIINGGIFKHNSGVVISKSYPNYGSYIIDNYSDTTSFYDLIIQSVHKDDSQFVGEIIVENKLVLDSGSFSPSNNLYIKDSLIINTGFDNIEYNQDIIFNGAGNGHIILNKPLVLSHYSLLMDKENSADTVHCYKGIANSIEISSPNSLRDAFVISKGVVDFPEAGNVNLSLGGFKIESQGTLINTSDTLEVSLSRNHYSTTIPNCINEGSYLHNSGTISFKEKINFDASASLLSDFNNVHIVDTLTLEATTPINIKGNLTVVENARIFNNPQFYCEGNILFNTDSAISNVDIYAIGSNNQNLTITKSHRGNLTIDKSAGVAQLQDSLILSAIVNQNLQLENGELDLNGNVLQQLQSTPLSISRNTGFIRSENENSLLEWNILNAVSAFEFPFGLSNTQYIPVTITGKGNSDIVSVFTFGTNALNTPLPTGVSDLDFFQNGTENPLFTVDRFWNVNVNGAGATDVLVALEPTEIAVPNNITVSGLVGYQNSGANWNSLITTPELQGTNTVTITNYLGSGAIGLTQLPVYNYNDTAYICPTNDFVFHDGTTVNNVLTETNHTNNLLSVYSTDSIITTYLLFNVVNGTENSSICFNDSIIINGNTYNATNSTGSETILNGGSNGCDSIVTINLNIIPQPAIGVYNNLICNNDSVTVNGTTYNFTNASGTETILDGGFNGCDSSFTVNLSFYPQPTQGVFNTTLCDDDSIIVNGTTYNFANSNGIETVINGSINGCDSTYAVNLNFFATPTPGIFNTTLCNNDSIIVNGTTYNSSNISGTEIIENGSINGCDSTFVVSLSFYPQSSGGTNNSTLCNNDSLIINGNVYNAANPFGTEILPNVNGCDSSVLIFLNIIPTLTGSVTNTICNNDSVIINGNVYDINNPSGTETFDNVSANGCDSVVSINLSFYNNPVYVDNVSECTSFTWVDGTTYTASNNTATYTIAGAASNGCDSTMMLALTIENIDTNISQTGQVLSSNHSGANYQWLDCNDNNSIISGETNQTYSPPQAGNYAVEITKNNCIDTSTCYSYFSVSIVENNDLSEILVSPNPTNGIAIISSEKEMINSISILNIQGKEQKVINNVNSKEKQIDISSLSEGVYFVKLTLKNGSYSIVKISKIE
jgi:hypothetical protein